MWVAVIGVGGTVLVSAIVQTIGLIAQRSQRRADAQDRANERTHALELERARVSAEAEQQAARALEASKATVQKAKEAVALECLEAVANARAAVAHRANSNFVPKNDLLANLVSTLRRITLYVHDDALEAEVAYTIRVTSEWWKTPDRVEAGTIEAALDDVAQSVTDRIRRDLAG